MLPVYDAEEFLLLDKYRKACPLLDHSPELFWRQYRDAEALEDSNPKKLNLIVS